METCAASIFRVDGGPGIDRHFLFLQNLALKKEPAIR